MELIHVAAALCSAFLHAAWNAAVKADPSPARAMTAQMLLAALLMLPVLLWTGLPAPDAWGWLVASTLMNTVTVTALLRAYELAGFGLVYPVVRAIGVLLVVPLAAFAAGDRVGPTGLIGVALIAAALAMLGLESARDNRLGGAAMGWILLAGISTAIYVLCDAKGVRAAGSPWAYGCLVSATNALAMYWRQRISGSPLQLMDGYWLKALPIALASIASYLLILWVWSVAPIAPSAALRDTSAVFAILIAFAWLREPVTGLRLGAVLLAAAAIPLLRLG